MLRADWPNALNSDPYGKVITCATSACSAMPIAWTGHFDTATGISYQPNDHVLGRNALLIHSPWRVPPGKTWVEYRLRVPAGTPANLEFAIAMRPDSFGPDKSDGSTFSCAVIDESGEHELMREHSAVAEWKNFTLDLTPYAGKDFVLRLQVEPGPANSPSWDYSYFGDPAIVVGDPAAQAVDTAALVASPAFAAAAGGSLVALANNSSHGVTPSNLLPHTNTITADRDSYRFAYAAADCAVTYVYTPQTGTLDDFVATIDTTTPFMPAQGGGVTAVTRVDGNDETTFLRGGRAQSIELSPNADALHVVWAYPFGERTVTVRWRIGIRGKALTIDAACDDPILSGFTLGREGNVPLRKSFTLPYLLGSVNYLPAQQVFTCRYLDWTVSQSSQCPQGDATYDAKTDGTRNPMHESGYVSVSPHVAEVLPNIPNPPSPYLDVIGPRIMLDVWQHHNGTYAGDAENLLDLKDNGVDHLAIISHVWQHFGYDVKLPDHIPANPQFGSEVDLREFGRVATESGYVWSLHENYIDMYPDAPSYDESARVLRTDGTPSPGWFNAGTGVQSFGIKSTRSLGFAQQNSPEVHARYGTNAAYLDVHTCVPPWHQLDCDAAQPMAAMFQQKVLRDTELFQYERDTHGGPLFGEGNQHFYWAGRCDGVEAQVAAGEDHIPFLDFDLLKIHPQMVNHGMGYYERWFRRGYDHQWGFDTGTPEQVDKYRAQEIAYGHAGFIGAAQVTNVQWVAKEHHLMHPIQRLANTAKVSDIAYEVDGRLVPSGVALATGQRLRQCISYDSGLRVWVNWAEHAWNVEGRVLPQWGFLALGPGTIVETTLHHDLLGDYAECPEFIFCDARTSFTMPYINDVKNIEPQLAGFEWLGDNKVRLEYRWVVNDTFERDYNCYVHFTSPLVSTSGGIAFQQDHALPKSTSQWKPGEVVMDGPFEIAIPDDGLTEYSVVIGLFHGERVPLQGVSAPGSSILLGTLHVERDGDKVTSVRLEKVAEHDVDRSGQADFTAHLNRAGAWIDFGPVATNGSIKINRGARELIVFPYPRETSFSVELDPTRVASTAPGASDIIHVDALAAGDRAYLGTVPFSIKEGRIRFDVGMPKAGRYRVWW